MLNGDIFRFAERELRKPPKGIKKSSLGLIDEKLFFRCAG